ncbi:MAG TPA: formylmethanofuran dehydrogenase subunit C [Fimbriiglobus sp.]|jgi:formylmethanofuran dehydrogenase subunit C
MALSLTRRDSSPIPVEVFGLTPDKLVGRNANEISRIKVLHGNREEMVGDHFLATGTLDADPVVYFTGDCSAVKGIGAGMAGGFVVANGPVGMHAGARMSGGRLVLTDASDWLGAEMTGGSIQVRGNAGNQAGAAYRGSRKGMRGGRIQIDGTAGDELGLLMRRGRISVGGAVGEFCGASMIAGTILVAGGVGPRCGAGMKRGTIVAFGKEPDLPPGFRYACEYTPAFARILDRDGEASDWGKDLTVSSVRLFRGDLTTGGRGEIWHVPSSG